MTMSEAQQLIDRITSGSLTWTELAGMMSERNESIRGSAMIALTEQYPSDPRTVALLREQAVHPDNQRRVIGITTLGQLAVKLLSKLPGEEAAAAVAELRANWPEDEREDLEWLMQSNN